jgi:hypothetical protein
MRKIQHFILIAVMLTFSFVAVAADSLEKALLDNVALANQQADNLIIRPQLQETAGADIWDRLQFQTENNKMILTYSYSKMTLNDPTIWVSDVAKLFQFAQIGFNQFLGNMLLDEMEDFYNAKQGDAGSRYKILENFSSKMEKYLNPENKDPSKLPFNQYLAQYLVATGISKPQAADLLKLGSSIAEATGKKTKFYLEDHKRTFAKNKRTWETWKKESKALDILDNSNPKLDDLIRNNDRAGVRKLVEAYLPWTMMEPFESAAWRSWLDAIETKATAENSQILLRGVSYDTDIPFRNSQGGVGFMSTVLTKNQGNYTRRLRSLAVRRIAPPLRNSEKDPILAKSPVVTIAKQLSDHVIEPVGSSFLSFTLAPKIAFFYRGGFNQEKNRSKGGFLAVRVPTSRTIPNGLSPAAMEVEMLLPLIVFPEDVVFYKETTAESVKIDTPDSMMNEMMAALSETDKEIFKRTQKLYELPIALKTNYAQSFSRITQSYSSSMNQCSGVFK